MSSRSCILLLQNILSRILNGKYFLKLMRLFNKLCLVWLKLLEYMKLGPKFITNKLIIYLLYSVWLVLF